MLHYSDKLADTWLDGYIYIIVIRDPYVYHSLAGSSIYSSDRAPQRTNTTVCTPIVCMILFQFLKGLTCVEEVESDCIERCAPLTA